MTRERVVQVAAVEGTAPRSYGNWRKPRSAGLFRLGKVGTMIMMAGIVLSIMVMMAGRLVLALGILAAVGVLMMMVVFRDQHDLSTLDRISERIGWRATKAKGAHLYRSGPLGFALWGTHQLPGIAASLRVSEHRDSYARPFALLHSPTVGTCTVVIATEPEGSYLVDQDRIDRLVADWGNWLANLSSEPGLEACSVTVETAPDTGHRLRREVAAASDPNASTFSQTMLNEIVRKYPSGSSTITAYVTLTFRTKNEVTGKKRTPEQMGRDLAARLPGLTADLAATGAGSATPIAAQELCEVVRTAYDPLAAVTFQDARAEGEEIELHWSEVGPVAAEAEWDGYHHDAAYSVTYAMSMAPRAQVQSNVLRRLLAPHDDIARKRVTLLYRPIDPARAAAIVESDVAAARFNQSSSKKGIYRNSAATAAAHASALEEAQGASLVNFAMLVTATVVDPEARPQARAAIDNLGASSKLLLRPVYGGQSSAFAAALPLGIVLPKHLSAASSIRRSL